MPLDGDETKFAVSAVLLRAAALLEQPEAWGQAAGSHNKAPVQGQFCAWLAIDKVVGKEPKLKHNCLDRFAAHIGGKHVWDIAEWNDQAGRTREEVCAALREAAR